jgi:hypothetical protein
MEKSKTDALMGATAIGLIFLYHDLLPARRVWSDEGVRFEYENEQNQLYIEVGDEEIVALVNDHTNKKILMSEPVPNYNFNEFVKVFKGEN